jgi:hypothetical protein
MNYSKDISMVKTHPLPQSKTLHDRKADPPTRACPRILRPGNAQQYRESAMVGWRPLVLND